MRDTMYSGASYDENDFSHERVPTREEIEEIEDPAVLWKMQDDYENACLRIEICLKYPGEYDRDWFFRARSALIVFRISARAVEKRLKVLMKSRPGPHIVAFAPDEAA